MSSLTGEVEGVHGSIQTKPSQPRLAASLGCCRRGFQGSCWGSWLSIQSHLVPPIVAVATQRAQVSEGVELAPWESDVGGVSRRLM